MKVSKTGPAGGPKRAGKAEKADKSDKSQTGKFAVHLSQYMGEIGEIHGVDAPAAVAGVDSIVATQSVEDSTGEEARRRMARRGEEILDKLEEVRHGLLRGHIAKDHLIEIAQTVRQKREQGADPQLSAILDEIELRAEVELAKLTTR